MTTPDEAARAIVQTRAFLFELLDPKRSPRVPFSVRMQARRLLKHYPFEPQEDPAIWRKNPKWDYRCG